MFTFGLIGVNHEDENHYQNSFNDHDTFEFYSQNFSFAQDRRESLPLDEVKNDLTNMFYDKIIGNEKEKEEKTTTDSKTLIKNENNKARQISSKNHQEKNNEEFCPGFYTSEDINRKLKQITSNSEIEELLINSEKDLKDSELYKRMELTKKKRKRGSEFDSNESDLNIVISNKTKRGRKSENNKQTSPHDKMSADNIIKKIKDLFFKSAINFINLSLDTEEKLLKLDYKKYINQINKEKDLMYLNMQLKDLLSLDISYKYKNSLD